LNETGKGSAGMPVGIQVIGLPFEDEKVLGFMKSLEKEVKFYEKFPLPKI
jgi:Asp-tRNA(Asn)/Glu-tRNA(Gln) amidotransferase A subunit family amidase